MPRQVIDTNSATLELVEGILHIISKGIETNLESITATFEAAMVLSQGRRIPVLFDARLWPGSTLDGWVYGIANLMANFTAVAMIVNPARPPEFGSRLDAIDRLMIPFRVFTEESEAASFLARHVEDS